MSESEIVKWAPHIESSRVTETGEDKIEHAFKYAAKTSSIAGHVGLKFLLPRMPLLSHLHGTLLQLLCHVSLITMLKQCEPEL